MLAGLALWLKDSFSHQAPQTHVLLLNSSPPQPRHMLEKHESNCVFSVLSVSTAAMTQSQGKRLTRYNQFLQEGAAQTFLILETFCSGLMCVFQQHSAPHSYTSSSSNLKRLKIITVSCLLLFSALLKSTSVGMLKECYYLLLRMAASQCSQSGPEMSMLQPK